MKQANRSSHVSSRKPATAGFLQPRFVAFGPDNLYAAGGEEDVLPAHQRSSLSGMPGLTFLTNSSAWGEGCGLGEDWEVWSSWIKQVTISTVQRPSEGKASTRCQHAVEITARLPQGRRATEKLLAPRLPDLKLPEAVGVPPRSSTQELTGCCRRTAAAWGHHLQRPNCCLSPKSFPPSATTVVFVAPFGQTVVLAWFKRRAIQYSS